MTNAGSTKLQLHMKLTIVNHMARMSSKTQEKKNHVIFRLVMLKSLLTVWAMMSKIGIYPGTHNTHACAKK